MKMRPISNRLIAPVILIVMLLGMLYLGGQKNFGWPQYAQLALEGLRGGAIYALIALGIVTIYNVTGIINFAQGGFAMMGAMLAVSVNNLELIATWPVGLRLILAFFVAVGITTLVGLFIERVAIYPARDAEPLTHIIITVGIFIVMQGIAFLIWGADQYILPAFTTLEARDMPIRFAGILIKAQSFWIWGTVAIVVALLYYFFEKTMWGKALRACAINRQAARLMGIDPSRMSALSFALAAALGAIGGFVLGPATRPSYNMGLTLGLKGFVAAIMGGLVNPPAAVLGGILLGMIENLGAGITKAGIKDIFAFIILIFVLLFRPDGILSKRETIEKV